MENRVELESAPITSIRMETPINRNRSGRILFTPSSNPRRHPLPSLQAAWSQVDYPGASLQTDAHVGAFILVSGAPETADIVARRHPKVSKIGSPCHLDVVGENLIEN
jgi:hypothetical protein